MLLTNIPVSRRIPQLGQFLSKFKFWNCRSLDWRVLSLVYTRAIFEYKCSFLNGNMQQWIRLNGCSWLQIKILFVKMLSFINNMIYSISPYSKWNPQYNVNTVELTFFFIPLGCILKVYVSIYYSRDNGWVHRPKYMSKMVKCQASQKNYVKRKLRQKWWLTFINAIWTSFESERDLLRKNDSELKSIIKL